MELLRVCDQDYLDLAAVSITAYRRLLWLDSLQTHARLLHPLKNRPSDTYWVCFVMLKIISTVVTIFLPVRVIHFAVESIFLFQLRSVSVPRPASDSSELFHAPFSVVPLPKQHLYPQVPILILPILGV